MFLSVLNFEAKVGIVMKTCKYFAWQKRGILNGANEMLDYEKKRENIFSGIFSLRRSLRFRNDPSVVFKSAAI